MKFVGHLFRKIVSLRPILIRVVELPYVVVERRRRFRHEPRGAMTSDRSPTFMVNAAIPKHLEVLRLAALRSTGFVETIEHTYALHRHLSDAVYH